MLHQSTFTQQRSHEGAQCEELTLPSSSKARRYHSHAHSAPSTALRRFFPNSRLLQQVAQRQTAWERSRRQAAAPHPPDAPHRAAAPTRAAHTTEQCQGAEPQPEGSGQPPGKHRPLGSPQPSLPPQGSVQRAGSAARCPHRHRPRGAPPAAAQPRREAASPRSFPVPSRCRFRAVARPRPLPLGRRRCGCSRRRALRERRGAERSRAASPPRAILGAPGAGPRLPGWRRSGPPCPARPCPARHGPSAPQHGELLGVLLGPGWVPSWEQGAVPGLWQGHRSRDPEGLQRNLWSSCPEQR